MRSRREFLIDTAIVGMVAAAPAWACRSHAPREFSQLKIFNADEAWALDSILAQLIPASADLPGARETKVLIYFDRELQKPEMKSLENAVRYGIHALNHAAKRAGTTNFARLSADQQNALLGDFQHDTLHMGAQPTSPIFAHLLALALEGYLCDPKYGGNADCKGWRAVGVEMQCLPT
jgi:gluconate 2-dehydrogenase gamma chain